MSRFDFYFVYVILYVLFYKKGSTHGVVLDSTGMCRAVNAAVGNHKPKTK